MTKGKKISIMAEFDFFQKVWYRAGREGSYREGIVVGIALGPALDVLYQVTWDDGNTSDHFGQELMTEQPKEWESDE
jgi:hypothetical protein